MRILLILLTSLSVSSAAATVVNLEETRPLARPSGEEAMPFQPPSARQALIDAMSAKNRKDWPAAAASAQYAGPLAMDLIMWHRLRAGDGQFEETLAFLDRRPDWPGLPLLRKNSEPNIPADAHVADVVAFFGNRAPRTLTGSLRLAQSYRALGREEDAVAEALRGWTTHAAKPEQEEEMRLHFGPQLASASADRLNAMLWANERDAAIRLLDTVSDPKAKLAEARLALQLDLGTVDTALEAVPANLQNDAGLAYDRFQWRLRKGRIADAKKLILARSNRAADLGQPQKWASQRIRLTRDLMWDQDWSRAYHMASDHYLTEGQNYAELEWLAGYIALRQLALPDRALQHFQAHGAAVQSPISTARTHYWQGMAHRALKDEAAAIASFTQGATYQIAFYGLLSAEQIGASLDPALTGAERFDADATAPITQDSNYEVAEMLIAAGHPRLAIRFLTHLSETQDRDTIGVMTAIAEAQDRPSFELLLAKRAIRFGHTLHRAYLPLHPLASQTGDVPAELALSIARRESEFFVDAASGVGARGLMQLMPPTAKEMAGKIGLPFSQARLTTDQVYNATLGVAYLDELQGTFGSSPVQIAAAYNAGPSRPKRWMRVMGDPRNNEIDVVDWIERVPFTETRNYIMRVTETMPGYRARLTGQTGPVQFRALLNGQYIPPPPPLAPATSPRPVARPLPAPVPATE